MAIADFATFKAELVPSQSPVFVSMGPAVTAGRTADGWISGAIPAIPVRPNPTTAVALGRADSLIGRQYADPPGGTSLSVLGATMDPFGPLASIWTDRLSHQGGLVANGAGVTTQTTNLPTAPLTRYTSGAGVIMGLSIYVAIGTVAVAVRVSYTNQDGTAGQISPDVQIGATGFNAVGRIIILPFAAGDTGVRSVESVTMTGATGVGGAFGVTLFKPLFTVINQAFGATNANCDMVSGGFFGAIPEIPADTCLSPIALTLAAGSTNLGMLRLSEH